MAELWPWIGVQFFGPHCSSCGYSWRYGIHYIPYCSLVNSRICTSTRYSAGRTHSVLTRISGATLPPYYRTSARPLFVIISSRWWYQHVFITCTGRLYKLVFYSGAKAGHWRMLISDVRDSVPRQLTVDLWTWFCLTSRSQTRRHGHQQMLHCLQHRVFQRNSFQQSFNVHYDCT